MPEKRNGTVPISNGGRLEHTDLAIGALFLLVGKKKREATSYQGGKGGNSVQL